VSPRIVTLADAPDLADAVLPLLAGSWPAYMLDGIPGHGLDIAALLLAAPQYQVLLVEGDYLLAAGLSVPLRWDITRDELPEGWDDAVVRSAKLIAAGDAADTVCALSITMAPAAAGRGLSATMTAELKSNAARAGAQALIVPVRPVLKHSYPLIPMADYVGWRDSSGRMFDPWLRVHLDAGAQLAGVAEASMTITGGVAAWSEWTGLALPGSGHHVIPGALAPLHVDVDTDTGMYVEPNVWMVHPIGD
jgi:hypothetical protein